MKILTKAFGSVELDERQIIRVPAGLYGFEKFKEFALLDSAQKPFLWLQSTEVQELAFILIDPFLFKPDYEPDLPDSELSDIGIESPDDILVFAIVTVAGSGTPITANLSGPLVINKKTRAAAQLILADPKWKVKHDIMGELAKAKASQC